MDLHSLLILFSFKVLGFYKTAARFLLSGADSLHLFKMNFYGLHH